MCAMVERSSKAAAGIEAIVLGGRRSEKAYRKGTSPKLRAGAHSASKMYSDVLVHRNFRSCREEGK